MKYFLGIDQGGTKTAALVCDANGNILGVGNEKGLVSLYFVR
jgi:N-acetylglucosamine kinase-like BadF-type ATPase